MPPTPTTTPTIECDRLLLQPLRVDDAEEMAVALSDPALYHFIGGAPPTPMELRHLYERWVAGSPRGSDSWHNWAVRRAADGIVVGHVQATVVDHGREADIAWILGAPWQGRGYATEAAIALIRWLEECGVGAVTAHVNPLHRASWRVAERAGLRATDVVEGGEVVWRRVAAVARSRET